MYKNSKQVQHNKEAEKRTKSGFSYIKINRYYDKDYFGVERHQHWSFQTIRNHVEIAQPLP